jgi:hypothetical protein
MDVLAWGVSKWDVDDKLKRGNEVVAPGSLAGAATDDSVCDIFVFFSGVIIDGLWVSP